MPDRPVQSIIHHPPSATDRGHRPRRERRRWRTFPILGAALLALAGCGRSPQDAPLDLPPPAVVAVRAESRPIADEAVFVGRIVAVNRVDLRARVQGFLKERRFTEGQPVAAGDVLFVIEPDQYEALVEQRQADLEKAQADAQNAAAQFQRGLDLLKQKNIAQAKVDELQAADAVARASIAQAQAALTAAQLDLSYTQITAPVAGSIGLAQYTVGNLVGPSSNPLATLVSRDPIHVQFPVTQRDLLAAKRDIESNGGNAQVVTVRVRLPDGTLYEQAGQLDFVNVTTNQGTDSVTVRAALPNPKGILVDGQYVGVLIQTGEPKQTILIPQSALQIDQQGVFVLIIDGESRAQMRRIQTGPIQGAEIAVTEGLQPGELVITTGIQKVRPGQVVQAAPPTQPSGDSGDNAP